MSVLHSEYAIAAYFACCRIFAYFSKVRIGPIACFSAQIGTFDVNFNYFNIICVSI